MLGLLSATLLEPGALTTMPALAVPPPPPQQTCHRLGRRALLGAAAAAAITPSASHGMAEPDDLIALGTVRIKPGVTEPVGASEPGGALYVTVRVIPSNNVGTYVTAGKVPPLATARFASPIAFPYDVQLRSADLTPEYAAVPPKEWQQQDLTISARWDTDGTAATRGPDDLVGRGLLEKFGKPESGAWRRAEVVLAGRGLTGRLLTGGK